MPKPHTKLSLSLVVWGQPCEVGAVTLRYRRGSQGVRGLMLPVACFKIFQRKQCAINTCISSFGLHPCDSQALIRNIHSRGGLLAFNQKAPLQSELL